MAMQIKQIRYYSDNDKNNIPNDDSNTLENWCSGSLFADYYPITKISIQALPKTKFYINKSTKPIIIGTNGFFELSTNKKYPITEMHFDKTSINKIIEFSNYIALDIICGEDTSSSTIDDDLVDKYVDSRDSAIKIKTGSVNIVNDTINFSPTITSTSNNKINFSGTLPITMHYNEGYILENEKTVSINAIGSINFEIPDAGEASKITAALVEDETTPSGYSSYDINVSPGQVYTQQTVSIDVYQGTNTLDN